MLEDVYMACSVESGAGQPRIASAGIALPYRAQRCEGLSQHGGTLSTTGYLLLSWQDNSIADSGCCEYSKARALFVNVHRSSRESSVGL